MLTYDEVFTDNTPKMSLAEYNAARLTVETIFLTELATKMWQSMPLVDRTTPKLRDAMASVCNKLYKSGDILLTTHEQLSRIVVKATQEPKKITSIIHKHHAMFSALPNSGRATVATEADGNPQEASYLVDRYGYMTQQIYTQLSDAISGLTPITV
jgi:hypothetical protein